MSQWPKVKLGEVLRRVKRFESRDELTEYSFAGVGNFARGIFVGERKPGSAFALPKIQRIRAGDFIYSKLFAWEGGFGVAPKEADNCVMSYMFVVYELIHDKIDRKFLEYFFQAPSQWQSIGSRSIGTSDRRKILRPSQFEGAEIPLPPLAEQRRMVARIEELAGQIHEGRILRRQAAQESEALRLRVARDLFPEPDGQVVGNWIKFQVGYIYKSAWFSETGIRLARNTNIAHGTLDWTETVCLPESRRTEFRRFELQEGDILITLDRPIISTGVKVARVRQEDLPCLLVQRVARAQFPGGEVLPDYFFRWLHSPHFVGAIDPGRSNGVPHISHKDIEKIPFTAPPLSEQRRIVAELDAWQTEVDALKRLQAETAAELDSLLPAILDRVFKGESYAASRRVV